MPNIALCFLVYINFFIIYSKAGMVVINSLLMHKLGLEKQMTCPMSYSCYIAQQALHIDQKCVGLTQPWRLGI